MTTTIDCISCSKPASALCDNHRCSACCARLQLYCTAHSTPATIVTQPSNNTNANVNQNQNTNRRSLPNENTQNVANDVNKDAAASFVDFSGKSFAGFVDGSFPYGYRMTVQLGNRMYRGLFFTQPCATKVSTLSALPPPIPLSSPTNQQGQPIPSMLSHSLPPAQMPHSMLPPNHPQQMSAASLLSMPPLSMQNSVSQPK